MGAQFLRPIEIAILDGDNRILDFDVDGGTMDFSLVNNILQPMPPLVKNAARVLTPLVRMLPRVMGGPV